MTNSISSAPGARKTSAFFDIALEHNCAKVRFISNKLRKQTNRMTFQGDLAGVFIFKLFVLGILVCVAKFTP